ncbi:MAG: hypothetical protein ABII01_00650, partial [Candidatus Woesearchaeota archaeon]
NPSFRRIHEIAQDYARASSLGKYAEKPELDCTEYGLAFCALLSDNGYPPYLLVLTNLFELDSHLVSIYKEGDLIGTSGIAFSDRIHPSLNTIDGVLKRFDSSNYILINLNQQQRKDWIAGNGDYLDWKVGVQVHIPF